MRRWLAWLVTWGLRSDLANERRRFGYRRPFVLLRREGEPPGINWIYRLYREEGLTRPQAAGSPQSCGEPCPDPGRGEVQRALVAGLRPRQFANGQRFRSLNIVDDVTKKCLGAIPETSISGRRVARELTAIVKQHSKPGMSCRAIAPSSPATPCSPEARTQSSIGTLSCRESRCRTASSRVSTAACAMNCSTRPYSSISTTPAPRSRHGRRLQYPAASLVAEKPDPRGLRRLPHRNGRSAAQPRPAPSIVRCSTRATWRTNLETLTATG